MMRITLFFYCQNLTVVSLALACFFAVPMNFSRAETHECEKAVFPNPTSDKYRYGYRRFLFDKDGKSIYASCSDDNVYRLDINEKTVSDLGKLLGENLEYTPLIDLHPNQNLLLVAGGTGKKGGSVVLWDLKSRSVAKQFEITDCQAPFYDVFFLNGGKHIWVVASQEGSNRDSKFTVLETQSGKILQSKIFSVDNYEVDKTRGSIALIENTDDSNNIQIYSDLNASPSYKISFPAHTFSDVVFTKNGTSFLHYNRRDSLIGMRRLSQKADDFTTTLPEPVYDCVVSNNGKHMLLACMSSSVLAFVDLSTAKVVAVPNFHCFLTQLTFSDDNKLCAAIGGDDGGSIKVYDVDCLSRLCQAKGKVVDDILQGLKKNNSNENK